MMRKILIVTRIDFWRGGAGHKSRLSSLIRYFKNEIDLTVAFVGRFDPTDAAVLQLEYPEVRVDVLSNDNNVSYAEYRERFSVYMKEGSFGIIIFEYLDFSFVLPDIPESIITILDTHDLLSDRRESFLKYNLPCNGINLSFAEEVMLFKCFDYVIAIQENDYNRIVAKLGSGRTLLVPHPAECKQQSLRDDVRRIGYVASDYDPNVDAIVWFLEEAWPSIHERHQVSLEIYGGVSHRLPNRVTRKPDAVQLNGFVADLGTIYSSCDIMINPVRCGAGLKIKNVEALANGLPLVTTSHGAIGIETGARSAFAVADTPQEFITAIDRLVLDHDYHRTMSANAYKYAESFFSADRCYRDLAEVLRSVTHETHF